MPNGRSSPAAVLGVSLITGATFWWFVIRKPAPKFAVGQRVALAANPTETGTVEPGTTWGIGHIRAWYYHILFDSTGTVSGLLEERFLVAI